MLSLPVFCFSVSDLPSALGLSAHAAHKHWGQGLWAVLTPAQSYLPCSSLHPLEFSHAEIAPGVLLGTRVSELSTLPIPFFWRMCKPYYSSFSHLCIISSVNGCPTGCTSSACSVKAQTDGFQDSPRLGANFTKIRCDKNPYSQSIFTSGDSSPAIYPIAFLNKFLN